MLRYLRHKGEIMKIILSADEQIIKSWDYAAEKNGKEENQANLTVTNKRIISSVSNSQKFQYSDVALESIRKIDAYRDKKPNSGVFIIILGALFVIVGIVLAVTKTVPIAPYIFLALGAIIIILGIVSLTAQNKGTFYLSFSVDGSTNDKLEIGANNSPIKNNRSQVVNVKIDFDLVDEILSSIGAIIYDNKNR